MDKKKVWYGVLSILPIYGAYNVRQGDIWDGLIAGLIIATILFALGEAVFYVARKFRRAS